MSSLIERKALVLEAISSSSNGSNGSKVSSTQPSRLQTLYSELRTDKASLTELIECLETLTSSQSNAFWKRTNDLANDLISSVGLSEGCDLADRFPEEDESARSLPDALLTLLKISSLICAVLDTSKSRPVAMRETALTLHDILTTLNSESPQEEALQSSISKVCELYWLSKEADAEMFVTQLIPYLLLSAIAEDSNDTFVKRLASIRNAFLLLDFDDESIESIRGLLLRCFVHPRFLKVKI
jgi:condensin-2 complex subunit G2